MIVLNIYSLMFYAWNSDCHTSEVPVSKEVREALEQDSLLTLTLIMRFRVSFNHSKMIYIYLNLPRITILCKHFIISLCVRPETNTMGLR